MPRRGARRVWQRNQFEGAPFIPNSKGSSDDFIEFFEGKKLGDGQFADGNDQIGLKQIDLTVHPAGAVSDFVWRGNAVATRGVFPWKTTADGGEIDLRAPLFFVPSAKLLEPAEERAARSPRKRFAQHRLFHA